MIRDFLPPLHYYHYYYYLDYYYYYHFHGPIYMRIYFMACHRGSSQPR